MRFRPIFILIALPVIASVVACVGDSTVQTDGGGSDATTDNNVAPDGGDAGNCTPSCIDPNTLSACPTKTVACSLGCSTNGGAHCEVVQPQAPVQASDLSTAGITDLNVGANAFINTDTGAIDVIRPANDVATTFQIKNGIGFKLFTTENVGVFTVGKFVIAETFTLKARGKAALAIAAQGDVSIVGILDARGYTTSGTLCGDNTAGPGGHAGTQGAVIATGVGAGGQGDSDSYAGADGGQVSVSGGGGGGGFGGTGGVGGNGPNGLGTGGGTGGAVVGLQTTIAGGFGGGQNGVSLGYGGGGGGGVQIVCNGTITIGGGSSIGGINVGGCSAPQIQSGGGSGGAVVIETATLNVAAQGVIAANGGSPSVGQPGQLNGTMSAAQGAGGAGTSLNGVGGKNDNFNGTGGGGGVGRIHIENKTGTLTPNANGTVTPALTTSATTVTMVSAM